jgi:flagellar FliL protein
MKLSLIILAVVNFLCLAGGGTLAFMALMDSPRPKVEEPKVKMTLEDFLKKEKVFADKPIVYSLEPFTVNLMNQEEEKIVQVEVNLEMLDERSYEEIIGKSAMVRDTVVRILSEKKYQDIASIQGKLFLKDDISLSINKQLDYGFIKDIYFTRFMLQ